MSNPYSAPSASFSDADYAPSATYEPRVFALSGRIGRWRYLAYAGGLSMLIVLLLGMLVGLLAPVLGQSAKLAQLLSFLPFIVLFIIMGRRRLNDLDHSAWWLLLMFVPLVGLLLGLYLTFAAGSTGSNRHGPAPAKNSPWVVVSACAGPLFIAVIIAAFALPAYQGYLNKAKLQQLDNKL